MRPEELSAKLVTVAEFLEGSARPSRAMTAAAVRTVLADVRQAARVTKFVDKDFEAAVRALEAVTERLAKAAKTLNPQDEARASLEQSVEGFRDLRSALLSQFKDLSSVDI
jgi:hypothetical protein